MGICEYCGKSAGLFRGTHAACKQRAYDTEQKILSFFSRYVADTIPVNRFREMIEKIAAGNFISGDHYRTLVNRGIAASIHSVLADRELTEIEEVEILNLVSEFDADASTFGDVGNQFYQAMVLRKIKSGIDPKTPFKEVQTSLLLSRGEYIIWQVPGGALLKEKKRISYEGGSSGFSFRIMSGVYYRVGAYKGRRIEKKFIDVDMYGVVIITNRAVYIADTTGPTKKFLISKIISVTPYEDGLGFTMGGANPKPYIVQSPDSWFLVNCISALATQQN